MEEDFESKRLADVSVGVSLAATAGFMLACVFVIHRIFETGWKLRT